MVEVDVVLGQMEVEVVVQYVLYGVKEENFPQLIQEMLV